MNHPGRPERRKRYNTILRWIRRTHMYLGLLMIPWLLLYGITAYLFNHPGGSSGEEPLTLDAAALGHAGFDRLVDPRELADQVLADLEEDETFAARGFRIVHPEEIRYEGSVGFRGDGEARRHELVVSPERGRGTLRTRPLEKEAESQEDEGPATPVAHIDREVLGTELSVQLTEAASALLVLHDPTVGAVEHDWGPELRFEITDGTGEVWFLGYNLHNRRVRAWPDPGDPGLPSLSQFLTRLHTTRSYPDEWGLGSVWPLLVDLTATCMILWALSGLLMWWQMKLVRLSGAVTLVLSLTLATSVAFLMLHLFRQ